MADQAATPHEQPRDRITDRVDGILGRAFYYAHPAAVPDWDEPVEREDERYEDTAA